MYIMPEGGRSCSHYHVRISRYLAQYLYENQIE